MSAPTEHWLFLNGGDALQSPVVPAMGCVTVLAYLNSSLLRKTGWRATERRPVTFDLRLSSLHCTAPHRTVPCRCRRFPNDTSLTLHADAVAMSCPPAACAADKPSEHMKHSQSRMTILPGDRPLPALGPQLPRRRRRQEWVPYQRIRTSMITAGQCRRLITQRRASIIVFPPACIRRPRRRALAVTAAVKTALD